MKLELNKRYVRRDGVITGVLFTTGNAKYPFADTKQRVSYTQDGFVFSADMQTDHDIIDEYPEQPENPATDDLESRILNHLLEYRDMIPFEDYDNDIKDVITQLESRIANPAPQNDESKLAKVLTDIYNLDIRDFGNDYAAMMGHVWTMTDDALSSIDSPDDEPDPLVAELKARIVKLETGMWSIYAETALQSGDGADQRKLNSIIKEVRRIVRDATDPAGESAVVEPPTAHVYDSDTLDAAHRQMQTAIDATLCYPEAMQYLNDAGITFIIRDADRYHVTTLNDGTYTINESGFLFKQIKL